MKEYLFLSLVVLLVISCKEDDNVVDDTYLFSGTYTAKRIELAPVRLFTSKGEVYDISVIKSFLKNNPHYVGYYRPSSDTTPIPDEYLFKYPFVFNLDSVIELVNLPYFEFPSSSKAVFHYSNGALEDDSVKVIDNVIYLESINLYPFYKGEDFAELRLGRLRYHQLSKPNLVPLSQSQGSSKFCHYLEGDSRQLRIPYLDYMHKLDTGTRGQFGNNNNNINESLVSRLGVNDTIVFQVRYQIFEK